MRKQTITIGLAEDASATERFAAEELAKYLQRIVKAETKIMSFGRNSNPDFAVGKTAAETFASAEDLDFISKDTKEKEVFIAIERNGTVVLAGNRGRTTLYSVYHLLEKLGARWVYPGDRGAYLPVLETLDLTSLEEREEADFTIRSLAFDISFFLQTGNEEAQRRWVEEILDEVDWATKNKMNSLLLLSQPRFDDYRNNPLEIFWQKYKAEIFQAIKKRDLILEYGGHILPALIPTSLFESDKQLFRMKAGKRTKTGNFCVSYPKTLEILKRNAADFFKRHKEAKIFRAWPEDVLAGAWCSCPDCSKLSVYEQSYLATSTLSEALAEVDPGKYVDFLSYQDTLEPEGDIDPRENILLTYAPRERCYLHFINDPSCERNRDYNRWLLANYKVFGDNVYIFEYYADTILYWSLFVPLSGTISKDLEYLKGIGVNKASILLFGAHSFWLHGLNLFIFAKKTWDTTISTDVLKKDFVSALFPSASHLFLKLLEKAERVVPPVLDFTCENIGEKNVQTIQQKTEEANGQLFECEKIARNMEVKAESTEERRFTEALKSAAQYTRTLLSSGVTQLFPFVVPLMEGGAKGFTDEQVKELMQITQSAKKGLTEGNRILRGVDKEFLGAWGEVGRLLKSGFMLRLVERLTKMLAEGKDPKELELESA